MSNLLTRDQRIGLIRSQMQELLKENAVIPVAPAWAWYQDAAFVLAQFDAERARADQAESFLAQIADVLNQELRENGGGHLQVESIQQDMRPAIRGLVDCVRANWNPI